MKIQWKCSMCGYQFEGEPTPPDRCLSCKEACTFIDANLLHTGVRGTGRQGQANIINLCDLCVSAVNYLTPRRR